jgi:hypothetical protein
MHIGRSPLSQLALMATFSQSIPFFDRFSIDFSLDIKTVLKILK